MRAGKELAAPLSTPICRIAPTEGESPVDYTLFNEIPVDLMVRHQFLPLKKDARGLHPAMADPTDSSGSMNFPGFAVARSAARGYGGGN